MVSGDTKSRGAWPVVSHPRQSQRKQGAGAAFRPGQLAAAVPRARPTQKIIVPDDLERIHSFDNGHSFPQEERNYSKNEVCLHPWGRANRRVERQ